MSNIEYQRSYLDEIDVHLIQTLFLALSDAGSTSKQRRAIKRASDELTQYEKVVIEKELKKVMGA